MRSIICPHRQLTTCKIIPVDDRPDERLQIGLLVLTHLTKMLWAIIRQHAICHGQSHLFTNLLKHTRAML